MKKLKAFTIVELLVVMAVIGVLLSLAVFGIQALQKNQRETQRLNDLRNIQGSLESYYSKYRRYPLQTEFNVVDTNFEITYGVGVGAINFATIPIQSLTPTEFNDGYNSATCSDDDGHIATADTWWVQYHTSAAFGAVNPQEYALFACTENGKTTNLGSKNTD
ncbi:MAG: type II secretion system protein [bacterium]